MLCDRIEVYLNSGFIVGAWLEDGRVYIWKDIDTPCKWPIMRDMAEDLEQSINKLIEDRDVDLRTEDDLINFIKKEGYYGEKMIRGYRTYLFGTEIYMKD